MLESACGRTLKKGTRVILDESYLSPKEDPETVFTLENQPEYPKPCRAEFLTSKTDETTGMVIERRVSIPSKTPAIKEVIEKS